jgi:arabinogalactan endo-1,4-beta-galactosidase
VAWQSLTSIAALAAAVHDYTNDAVTQLVAGGAPDIVQIGNEITPRYAHSSLRRRRASHRNQPGVGKHRELDEPRHAAQSGVQGVKDVDPNIKIMLHIDRGGTFNVSRDFVSNAMAQGVSFDVFGESCYTAYQGPPSAWQSTFTQLAAMFPNLSFAIADCGPEQRAANDTIFNLPNQQGIGTFNWEPTHAGAWNSDHVLFSLAGKAYRSTADLALYDLMKTAFASRL